MILNVFNVLNVTKNYCSKVECDIEYVLDDSLTIPSIICNTNGFAPKAVNSPVYHGISNLKSFTFNISPDKKIETSKTGAPDFRFRVKVPLSFQGVVHIDSGTADSLIVNITGKKLRSDRYQKLLNLENNIENSEACFTAMSNIVLDCKNTKEVVINNNNFSDIHLKTVDKASVKINTPKLSEDRIYLSSHVYVTKEEAGICKIDMSSSSGNVILACSHPDTVINPTSPFSNILRMAGNKLSSVTINSTNGAKTVDSYIVSTTNSLLSTSDINSDYKAVALNLAVMLVDVFYLSRLKLAQSMSSSPAALNGALQEIAKNSYIGLMKKLNVNHSFAGALDKKLSPIARCSSNPLSYSSGRKRKYKFISNERADKNPLKETINENLSSIESIISSTSSILRRDMN